jgi:hypothetical protein
MKISRGKIRALLITAALSAVLYGVALPQVSTLERPGTVDSKPSAKLSNKSKEKSKPKSRVKQPVKPAELAKSGWIPAVNIKSPAFTSFGGGTYEKSISVDPRISVSLCVTQGDVKINGWSRNEVRVFVKDGSKIGFNTLQKSRQNEKPVWIKVVGFDPAKPAIQRECLWGDQVEIDVPTGAAINLEGKATSTVVDSVRKIAVKNAGGSISIRNIAEGVDATTYQGDVDVENSDGMITLETTSGNILVFESGPSQVGDIFKARSNSGKISLQNLEHIQVDVNSISGSVLFSGNLLGGGIYGIKTSNGSLTLNIPPDSPCFLSATYMEGNFSSELPFKLITENITPGPVKSIKGILGKGDCKLNLANSSGAIRIRKQ